MCKERNSKNTNSLETQLKAKYVRTLFHIQPDLLQQYGQGYVVVFSS
jgi:hypothetical protein